MNWEQKLEADMREAAIYASELSNRIIQLEADKAGLVEALEKLTGRSLGKIKPGYIMEAESSLTKHGGSRE